MANFKSGVLGALTYGYMDSKTGQPVWEWAEIDTMSVMVSTALTVDGREYIFFVRPGNDFYVYRMESGSTFDGLLIRHVYRTPDLALNDPDKRKTVFRIIPETKREGLADIKMHMIYDYGTANTNNPPVYTIAAHSADGALWNTMIWGAGVWGHLGEQAFNQPVEGSGKHIALRFSGNAEPSHIIKTIAIEFKTDGSK